MSDANDLVSPCVRELIHTWETLLPEVSFPDVDLAVLQTLAEELRSQGAEVERARAALDEAQRAFEDRRQRLRDRALRGLAYAKVYAEGDEELTRHLGAIGLQHTTRAARHNSPKKPRRTTKTSKPPSDDEAVLPFDRRAERSAAEPDTTTAARTM